MPDPHVIVLFGARGDLAHRKLWPGLARLTRAGLMPDDFRVIGTGRHEPDGELRDELAEALEPEEGDEGWARLAERISFVASSADDGEDLAAAVRAAREGLGNEARVLLYLSVPPSAMAPMVQMLGATGLADRARIVLEKPFGHDLASARELNALVHEHFDEEQVFRIDHFLGKEAAQDLLALKFANGLFAPVWHCAHVAAVQIDVPETLGLEGRASFYEETGALRDMIVTHLAQILGLVALQRPDTLDAEDLRDAKAAVFAALRPIDPAEVVFGQYEGYRDEDGVDDASRTETYVAARVWVDTDCWRDVPFLLRTGKALAEGRRRVTLVLRDPGAGLFDGDAEAHRADVVAIELADDPEITAEVRVKVPGPELVLTRAALTLDVEDALHDEGNGLEAYQRLLHDVMLGRPLLFARADEVEHLWSAVTPVLEDPPEPVPYAQGSWGPAEADALAAPTGGWRLPG